MEYVNRGETERRERLVILTDMENEQDDSQTMVRLLMYANEIDIEGLIAVTSCWLQYDTYPESIRDRVQAYGIVRPNLQKHAEGWPSEEYLLSRIASGQKGYGMDGVGDGKNTAGSELIIRILDKDDPRPVWFAINAGANTLAQAIWDVARERSPEEVARFVSKIRVYDDAGQDDAGAWMCHTYPDLFYIRSRTQVFALYGPSIESGPQVWGPDTLWKDDQSPFSASVQPMTQWRWAEAHVRRRHGILGALYPQRVFEEPLPFTTMDGGGSTGILGLINKGLYEPDELSWGGWGGRFSREKVHVPAGQKKATPLEDTYLPFAMYPQTTDTWRDGNRIYENSEFAPVFRWREAYTNDFKARMDWCVSDYGQANHPPVAAFDGDKNRTTVRLRVQTGETVKLDASESYDPDGNELAFRWYVYPEAGTYPGTVSVLNPTNPIAGFQVPLDAAGSQIHIILEVTDNDPAPFTSYRRIVADVV